MYKKGIIFHFQEFNETVFFFWEIYNLGALKTTKEFIFWTSIFISQLYPISAIVLFCCLVETSSIITKTLAEDIRDQRNKGIIETNSPQLLTKWKRKNMLICEFVGKINQCFGLIILLFTMKQFINFITFSFSIVLELRRGEISAIFFIFLAKNSIYLAVMMLLCQRRKNMVYFLYFTLFIILFYIFYCRSSDLFKYCKKSVLKVEMQKIRFIF